MRLRFFLWASADLGVRRSKVASSFCRSGYIELLRENSGQLRFRKTFPEDQRAIRLPGRLEPPGDRTPTTVLVLLEVELQSKLQQAWIASLQHLAERRVAEVAVRVDEFRFIKQVENVSAELEVLRVRKGNLLGDGNIPLVLARAAANRARRSGKVAQRGISEIAGINGEVPGFWRTVHNERLDPFGILDLKRSAQLWCSRAEKEKAADQFSIIRRVQPNGESTLELDDSGELPVVEGLAGESAVLSNRKIPDVVDDESLLRVEQGKSTAGLVVEWVDGLFEAGSPVERFAEGIGSLKLQALRETLLDAGLEGVVRGRGDSVFGEDVGEDRYTVDGTTGADIRARLDAI